MPDQKPDQNVPDEGKRAEQIRAERDERIVKGADRLEESEDRLLSEVSDGQEPGPAVAEKITEIDGPAAEVTPIDPTADISGEGATHPTRNKILEIDDVTLRFGGVVALNGVSFHINEGEILGLIGPNGAGKTTCFNVMTGVYQPTSGQVRYEGQVLGRRKKHTITKMGIARTFQNIRLFSTMTALENVLVGTDAHHTVGAVSAILRTPKFRREEEEGMDRAHELLKFMGLERKADELASNLSYGDQRRLEIARALATKPKLLCLDEPAAGFNPAEKKALMELIQQVRDQGYTVLLIEHDMKLVMGVTDRIVVLEFGRKIAEGLPADIQNDPAVIAAYLGVDEEDAS